MKIFYFSTNYPEKRCIIDKSPEDDYIYILSEKSVQRAIEKLINRILFMVSDIKGEKTLCNYFFLGRKGVIHSFNYCCNNATPWVCSFETIVPRSNLTRELNTYADMPVCKPDSTTLKGIHRLADKSCLGILALSEASMRTELKALDSFHRYISEAEYECLIEKLQVICPPQKLLITNEETISKFNQSGTLNFLFIGNLFFRKGGAEVIDILSKYSNNYNFHLTVVSNMEYGDDVSMSTEDDYQKYLNIIDNTSWITHYESIPNEEVLKLCSESHIGLFTSYADTYGYSVLEMQASGCPVISTDIRALSEINNDSCGWTIHLPQNDCGEAFYQTEANVQDNKRILANELETIINSIFSSDSSVLLNKALNSLERIRLMHSPTDYASKLDEIYNRANS